MKGKLKIVTIPATEFEEPISTISTPKEARAALHRAVRTKSNRVMAKLVTWVTYFYIKIGGLVKVESDCNSVGFVVGYEVITKPLIVLTVGNWNKTKGEYNGEES